MCSLGEALAAMLPGGRRETEPEEYAAEAIERIRDHKNPLRRPAGDSF